MEILDALKNNGFATADYFVFIAYIVILVGMGIFLSRGKKGEEKSSTDYFLAGNTLTWWAVGASLIAANISAEQFIGMSGSAYVSGIAMAAYELMAAATLIVVGKFLLPLMIEKKIFTIPQFLSERYNWGVGLAFSIFWLFLYVFINLTSVAWLGALAMKQILGLPTIAGVFMGMNVDMTYLNQSNAWLRNPPIECVKNVYRNFRQMIKAEGHYYNFGLPIGLIYLIILGIINSIKTKKKINVFNKLVYFAVYCAFAITPLLLTIYLGNPPPLRTQFYLPIIEALVLMIMGYSMMKIPKINVLCSCVFFVIIMLVYSDQASITSKLYYGDHQTRVNDMQIAYQLLYDMRKAGIKEHESIYIYGHFDDRINKSAMTGEMIGYSLFENGYGMQPYFWYSTESVLKLFKSLGYYYNMIPIEYGEDAYNQAKDMEDIWPKENAIKWVEPGYWIIKIAEK